LNIDGHTLQLDARAEEEARAILTESVHRGIPLYPTVSLLSPHVRVWCRFCDADTLQRSAQAIGAPEGVRVYGLDGSSVL
jgi:hypothetical protein